MSLTTTIAAATSTATSLDVALGQPVAFTWHLTRRTEHRPIPGDRYKRTTRWKVWKTEGYPGQPEPAPRRGIVIGVRRLANGRADYEYEVGMTWDPATAERFTAYLVAFDMRHNPVLVLPEHLQPLDQTHDEEPLDA